MSRAAQSGETLPERAVRNPSRYGERLHRIDEDAERPQPACPEAGTREVDWNEVPVAAYRSHYEMCANPECFGREWR